MAVGIIVEIFFRYGQFFYCFGFYCCKSLKNLTVDREKRKYIPENIFIMFSSRLYKYALTSILIYIVTFFVKHLLSCRLPSVNSQQASILKIYRLSVCRSKEIAKKYGFYQKLHKNTAYQIISNLYMIVNITIGCS